MAIKTAEILMNAINEYLEALPSEGMEAQSETINPLEKLVGEYLSVEKQIQEIILTFAPEEMAILVRDIDNHQVLQALIELRFLDKARLDNDDVRQPYIVWEPMNRQFEYWVGLAMAKILKLTQNIQPDDMFLMIPSSGRNLEEPFKEVFPEHLFVDLGKELDREEENRPIDQEVYDTVMVPSHSDSRRLKKINLYTSPDEIKRNKVWILDDVIARGDAVLALLPMLEKWDVEVREVWTVMDKSMQEGAVKIRQKHGLSVRSMVTVHQVQKQVDGNATFNLV